MEIAKPVQTKIWANFRVKESTTISHTCFTVSVATDPIGLAGNLGAFLPFFPSLHSFCLVLWISCQPLNTFFQPHYCFKPGCGGDYVICGSLPCLHTDLYSWVQPRKTLMPDSQVSKPFLERSKAKVHSHNGKTGPEMATVRVVGAVFFFYACVVQGTALEQSLRLLPVI